MNGTRTTLINAAVFFIAPPLAGFAFIVFVRACCWLANTALSDLFAGLTVFAAVGIAAVVTGVLTLQLQEGSR